MKIKFYLQMEMKIQLDNENPIWQSKAIWKLDRKVHKDKLRISVLKKIKSNVNEFRYENKRPFRNCTEKTIKIIKIERWWIIK